VTCGVILIKFHKSANTFPNLADLEDFRLLHHHKPTRSRSGSFGVGDMSRAAAFVTS
jgi:hypothetical protein